MVGWQHTILGRMQTQTTCPECHGTGQVIEHPCETCDGQGRTPSREKVRISIPAGVDTGAQLVVEGAGEAGVRGDAAGDLVVRVDVAQGDRFVRQGDDLFCPLSVDAFEAMLGAGDVAGVIVSQPNYYGIVEDYDGWADTCHSSKALLIMNCHASTLGALRSPGEWGADIACGEAQSLGMPLNYGGPYLGYLCCRENLIRKMPGRIVGATTDAEGRRSFVLTLQAREQHIRRQKATSNICSNQGIMTLHAAFYLALMGAEGLRRVNTLSYNAAHALADTLCDTGMMRLKYPDKPFFNEFALETIEPLSADAVLDACLKKGILGGVRLTDNTILVAATEMNSPTDIALYAETVKSLKS